MEIFSIIVSLLSTTDEQKQMYSLCGRARERTERQLYILANLPIVDECCSSCLCRKYKIIIFQTLRYDFAA